MTNVVSFQKLLIHLRPEKQVLTNAGSITLQ